jgi:hypothetical protein
MHCSSNLDSALKVVQKPSFNTGMFKSPASILACSKAQLQYWHVQKPSSNTGMFKSPASILACSKAQLQYWHVQKPSSNTGRDDSPVLTWHISALLHAVSHHPVLCKSPVTILAEKIVQF